jgi:ribonucleotide reductase alpha subunit
LIAPKLHVTHPGEWSLFCPNEAPGLPDCWGEKFEALYEGYEQQGLARKTVKARALWQAILEVTKHIQSI